MEQTGTHSDDGRLSYCVLTESGEETVVGYQIGRFGVRNTTIGLDSMRGEHRPWRVDHIPTGFVMGAFEHEGDAWGFADDMSRFSLQDPASEAPQEAGGQIGEHVMAWARFVKETRRFMPFRDWLRETQNAGARRSA